MGLGDYKNKCLRGVGDWGGEGNAGVGIEEYERFRGFRAGPAEKVVVSRCFTGD